MVSSTVGRFIYGEQKTMTSVQQKQREPSRIKSFSSSLSYLLSRAFLPAWRNLLAVWPVFTALSLPWHWQWGAVPRGSMWAAGDLWTAGRRLLLPTNPHQHLCGLWRPSLPHLRWLPVPFPGNLLLPAGSALLGDPGVALLQCGGQKWKPWRRLCVLAQRCHRGGVRSPSYVTQRKFWNSSGDKMIFITANRGTLISKVLSGKVRRIQVSYFHL